MKSLFMTFLGLVFILTMINNLRVRLGYKQRYQLSRPWLMAAVLFSVSGAIYYGNELYHDGIQHLYKFIVCVLVFAMTFDLYKRHS